MKVGLGISRDPTSFNSNKESIFSARVKKIILDDKNYSDLFKEFTNPEHKTAVNASVNKALQTPATVQHLYMMLSDYDHQVVQEAVQLRRFVTNKLIVDKESKMLGIRRQNNLIVSDLNETETTLKHEYAHTLGMLHCPKKNCIMYEDETYAKDFCNTCKKNLKEINFVE